MKKYLIMSFIMMIFLISCKNKDNYTIHYHYDDKIHSVGYMTIDEIQNSLLIPSKKGHKFLDWYFDKAFNEIFSSTDIESKKFDLYAKFEKNIYKVFFDPNGGSFVDPMYVEYEGMIENLPTTSFKGHTFFGWYYELSATRKFEENKTIVHGDIVLYAIWNADKNIVNLNSQYGGAIEDVIAFSGERIKLPHLYDLHKNFIGWYYDQEFTRPFLINYMPRESISLYAKWENKTTNDVTIKFVSNTLETFSDLVVEKGYHIDVLPYASYSSDFLGWYMDKDCTKAFSYGLYFNEAVATQSITLYALISTNKDFLLKATSSTPDGSGIMNRIKYFNCLIEKKSKESIHEYFEDSSHAFVMNIDSYFTFEVAGSASLLLEIDQDVDFFDLFTITNNSYDEEIEVISNDKSGMIIIFLNGGGYSIDALDRGYLYNILIKYN